MSIIVLKAQSTQNITIYVNIFWIGYVFSTLFRTPGKFFEQSTTEKLFVIKLLKLELAYKLNQKGMNKT